MEKKNKNCALCQGKGKLRNVKTFFQIGPYHLGKEDFKEDCFVCKGQNTFEIQEENEINSKKTLH
tara:strand:- start:84 stop:278 length:195 start_codon:yes stop_codon:yes gene_type:complete